MTRTERTQKTAAKKKAILGNFVAKTFTLDALTDDEGNAAYWVGLMQLYKRPVGNGEFKFLIDEKNALQIYLNRRPLHGHQHRMIGRVTPARILECWRLSGEDTLHVHPRLQCWTIARYPIVNAARFGFNAIQINNRRIIPVELLLVMPEVPAKERGGYERQIQIEL